MLEKMSDFFEARLDTYDSHMLTEIESAPEFYTFTAECLPKTEGCSVLDLGCGTGLELEYYYPINKSAKVTGIDLCQAMLDALARKLPDKDITLICSSYFDIPFDVAAYDSIVSVESLHHFTKEEKIPLYTSLQKALKDGGYFILTDYFASTDEEEKECRSNLSFLKAQQSIADGELYHYDTPLTVAHELEALNEAGFSKVEVLKSWGNTHTIKATA